MSQSEISTELVDALEKPSELLASDDGLKETLDSISALSVTVMSGCDGAGVTLQTDGVVGTAAASDDYTLEIDKIQYDTGEGPCLEALKQSRFFEIKDVSREDRWPEFCRRAAELGFKSSLSFPLENNSTVGSLNLYAKTVEAFDESAIMVGKIFARHAAIAVQNARTYAAAREVTNHLYVALESRDRIGQAKGILMEREGIDDEAAFEMLKTISQNANVKLRDIAQKLVDDKDI